MMDCSEYRRSVLADPHDANPELALHRNSCGDCREYTGRLLRFEGRLERALRVSAPAAGDARRAPRSVRGVRIPSGVLRARRGWLAAAASVLVVLAVAGSLWLAATPPSLASAVVAHVADEPQAWSGGDAPVASPELAQVLRGAHMRLGADAGMVSYAQSCLFRGRHVPHLVVQTSRGPVTVMVLVHESVSKAVPFDEDGYRGIILPSPGHGSLAVLLRGQDVGASAIKQIAERVQGAIEWTG